MKKSELRQLIREEISKVLNEGTKETMKSYWLILNNPDQWAKDQFGHDTSKLSYGEKKEFEKFLELAKKNYKD
jgi:hypothetical protein